MPSKPLKLHREGAYMTLRELSQKAGVAVGTIWRIENHQYQKLQPRTMKALAAALGVHPSEIAEFVRNEGRERG